MNNGNKYNTMVHQLLIVIHINLIELVVIDYKVSKL